jgi:hypothetical protein
MSPELALRDTLHRRAVVVAIGVEADINRQAISADSVANDPQPTNSHRWDLPLIREAEPDCVGRGHTRNPHCDATLVHPPQR